MSHHRLSCILVTEQQQLVGIFTERDIIRAIAAGLATDDIPLGSVMTQPVITASLVELDTVSTVVDFLQRHQIRYLPVIDSQEELLGVITLPSLLNILPQVDDAVHAQLQTLLEVQNRYEMMGMVGEQVLYEWDSQADRIIWGGSTTVLGYSLAEMPTDLDDWIAMIHPDERIAFKQALDQALKEQTGLEIEYRLLRKNGEYLWVEDKFQLFPVGDQVREVGYIADITKRKQNEAEKQRVEIALQQRNKEFQAIFEAFPDLFFRIQADGSILDYETRNLAELYSHPEIFLGCKVQEILPSPAGAGSYQAICEAIATESVVSYEYALPMPDGEHYYEARMVRLHADQVIAIVRDISDRKLAEDALRQREQEFRTLAENSPDVIMRIDRAYRYVYVNPAAERETGRSAAEILGKTCQEFSLAETLPSRWYSTLQAVFTLGVERAIDYKVTTDAGLKYYASRIVPEFASDGSVDSILVVARDITQHKQSEELLKQQAARERVITEITRRMGQSLALDDILNTTVSEVQRLLLSDRVLIWRVASDWNSCVVAESVSSSQYSILGQSIYDPYLVAHWHESQHNDSTAIDDLRASPLSLCDVRLLERLQVRASLVVPILQGDELWGVLAAHHCSTPRVWQKWEANLLKQLANQLAIAIQQARLYEQLQAANQELQRLALLDSLTQVGNRRCFDEQLHQEWHRLARDRLPLSLILCDVDGFKRFNDLYGHVEGDRCLVQIAQSLLQASRRPADLAARYGGEEFAIVLPNTDQLGAVNVAIAIQTHIQTLHIPHSGETTSPSA